MEQTVTINGVVFTRTQVERALADLNAPKVDLGKLEWNGRRLFRWDRAGLSDWPTFEIRELGTYRHQGFYLGPVTGDPCPWRIVQDTSGS